MLVVQLLKLRGMRIRIGRYMFGGESIIIWSPKLNDAEAAKRIYTTYGKKTLEAGEPWTPVATPAQGGWRFFKVGVDMR